MISRRWFLKLLGIGGAVAAATATLPEVKKTNYKYDPFKKRYLIVKGSKELVGVTPSRCSDINRSFGLPPFHYNCRCVLVLDSQE